MRLFWELSKLAFRRQITYRAATLAGLATNFFFGLLRAAVLVALYHSRQEVSGISVEEAVTYTGLSQASIAFLSLFGWYDILRSIHTGAVGADLLKPVSFYRFWLAQDSGRAIAQVFLRSIPILVFYALIFGITTPQTFEHWLGLAISLLLAWSLSFAWRFLLNLPAFWSPNALGIARMGFMFSWFFSGFLMPLRFFPDWFTQICNLTPFPHMVNTIIEIYLGLLSGGELLRALLAQFVWLLLLVFIGRLVLQAGVRKLVIQGG
jgi:ABC-2 type transport system permease protein